MIEIENDNYSDFRLGDTVAYSPPEKLIVKTKEELDEELREFLKYMAGYGETPESMRVPKIHITFNKKAASLDEVQNADYYMKVKDGFLYRTKT